MKKACMHGEEGMGAGEMGMVVAVEEGVKNTER